MMAYHLRAYSETDFASHTILTARDIEDETQTTLYGRGRFVNTFDFTSHLAMLRVVTCQTRESSGQPTIRRGMQERQDTTERGKENNREEAKRSEVALEWEGKQQSRIRMGICECAGWPLLIAFGLCLVHSLLFINARTLRTTSSYPAFYSLD
jgi:hypothetical protein